MGKKKTDVVTFSNNRIFITLILQLVFGAMFSLIPPEHILLWLCINIGIAIVLALVNYVIWVYHKSDSKRYHSLHSFVMLFGFALYMMLPAFRGLYSSSFFWLLLLVTVALTGFLIYKYDAVTNAFVNPGDSWFFKLISIFGVTVFLLGGILWAYMNATETGPFIPVAIILFFIGFFILMLSPIMLATPERVEELRQRKYQ
ncbi:hypothetical protein D1B33_03400 [Lysinibacillus yapensis]|uniref:Uncharacterized protein n=1 Tax=Ureibacillus yapensis TaxID=2304605 RepID=A0A396SE97_9BACL|nr:hypothetical protein [Lysinibacillus yapensis]RHW39906.1 hypothetical protein D1B33_03400 [Lysinibacillus yapensis]